MTYEEKMETMLEHGVPCASIVFDAIGNRMILIDGVVYNAGTLDPELVVRAFRRIGPKVEPSVGCKNPKGSPAE